jgi:hypothetical protein
MVSDMNATRYLRTYITVSTFADTYVGLQCVLAQIHSNGCELKLHVFVDVFAKTRSESMDQKLAL